MRESDIGNNVKRRQEKPTNMGVWSSPKSKRCEMGLMKKWPAEDRLDLGFQSQRHSREEFAEITGFVENRIGSSRLGPELILII